MNPAPFLAMRGITKSFPGVMANDHIDLEIYSGEVHALLGENGAGKSTLMKILYGFYRAYSGEIRLNGQPMEIPRAPVVMRSAQEKIRNSKFENLPCCVMRLALCA